jgi:hypothetical protein
MAGIGAAYATPPTEPVPVFAACDFAGGVSVAVVALLIILFPGDYGRGLGFVGGVAALAAGHLRPRSPSTAPPPNVAAK